MTPKQIKSLRVNVFQESGDLFGARWGVSKKAVSAWESGTRRPHPAILAAMERLLGFHVPKEAAIGRFDVRYREDGGEDMDVLIVERSEALHTVSPGLLRQRYEAEWDIDTRGWPKRIKALRAKMGLGQAEFGKLFGVSRQAVGVWEHGGNRMDRGRGRPPKVVQRKLVQMFDAHGIE